MSEHDMHEWKGETRQKLDEHNRRIESLEETREANREKRERNLIEGMKTCIKVAFWTTIFSTGGAKISEGWGQFSEFIKRIFP